MNSRYLSVACFAAVISTALGCASVEEPEHGFFKTSDEVNIHYMTLGDEGTWVVLIHGYTDSAERMWFTNGIATALAESHRVVALDNRNHGKSDKPEPNGSGRKEDVVELMDHLGIAQAHIHGYSMGGGITGRLLASNPELFITAGFGGSGIYEADEEVRAQVATLDPEMPEPEGVAASAFANLRASIAKRQAASDDGAAADSAAAARSRWRAALDIDLTKIEIPVQAINGEFDRPYSKTHRMWRQLKDFENVILPGKNHMTAIAVGVPMDQRYVDSLVDFMNANDPK